MVKKIFLILLAIFGILQLFRPSKNKAEGAQANNINTVVAVNEAEDKLLRKACYDCHSNNTTYNWYAEIMPVGWFLNNHIKEGKKHFNFDEFATYKPKKALHKLEEIAETVGNGSMPLKSYLIMHNEAKLSEAERKTIIDWAENSKKLLTEKYKASGTVIDEPKSQNK
jgi:cytochrome c551/c552